MRVYLFILGLVLAVVDTHAQQLPFQNHFLINPYVYHPALAGFENHAIAYVNRRQQFGNDAPSQTSFTFNTPVASSGGFGLSFYNTSYDTASFSLALASFARVIPLAEDQYLRVGIGFGFGFERIDLMDINNPGIPGLQSADERKAHFQSQIGVHYQWKALQVGLVLPMMMDPEPIDIENPDSFSGLDLDPFRGVMLSAGYLYTVNEQLQIQPNLLYRMNKDSSNQMEFSALVHIQQQFWVGASYRQDYGPVAMFGVRLQDIASIGYAVEFSGSQDLSPDATTHEVQLGIRLGATRIPVKKGFKIKKERPEGSKDPRFYYEPKRTGRSQ